VLVWQNTGKTSVDLHTQNKHKPPVVITQIFINFWLQALMMKEGGVEKSWHKKSQGKMTWPIHDISWGKTPKALIIWYKATVGYTDMTTKIYPTMKYKMRNTLSYVRIKMYHKTYAKSPFAARRAFCTKYWIHKHCKNPQSKLNLGMSLSQAFQPMKRITLIVYSSETSQTQK
jgi:hypothetical protein